MSTQDACPFRVLPNQPIEFRTYAGVPVGWTTSAPDGSYALILPAGQYRVFGDTGPYTDAEGEVTVYGWRIVHQDVVLWLEVP